MAVNLDKNRDEIIAAWKDVVDQKSSTDWALFGYEGLTNTLKVVSKGDGGIEELKDELSSGQIMYAFLKVLDPKTSLPKCVLINWQGEGAPLVRKGTCANHIRDISNLLHGAHITINARNDEEVDEEVVMEKVVKSTASVYSFNQRTPLENRPPSVGTVYQRVNAKNEINIMERDKFWEKEEQEEKKRLAEEKLKKEEMKKAMERQKEQMENEKKLEKDSPERSIRTNSSVREEAKELIRMRNFDPRAVFEKNVMTGPTHLNKSSSNSSSISETTPVQDIRSTVTSPVVSVVPASEPEEPTKSIQAESIPAEESSSDNLIQQASAQRIDDIEYVEEKYIGAELDFEGEGLKAEALYDYQAADETEISFDPGDIITHIDQIDTGWWQGLAPDGTFGLFPANYVQLLP